MSTFESFPLHASVLSNLAEMGYTSATDIQSQIMPIALEGQDVSGLSRTGTGKTAAFLIPTIQRLLQLPEDRIALCLAPTRELAQQIEQEAKKIAKGTGLTTVSVVGGMSSEDQIAALRKGARLVTGTPGRVIDLFKEKALLLQNVDVLIFDEADRMFDMGFIDDMHYVLKKVNPKRQILLFSATMNFSVLNMVYEYGANPQEINVSRDVLTAEKIKQVLYHVGDREKASALLGVCRKYAGESGTIIVFVNYKERVPWVAALLSRNGIPAQGLSSLLRQERRNKIIQGFKQGQFRALVATDVASRGLDVDNVSLVVNYHLPEEAATYVHRIGRTARAGRDGIAVAICSSEDAYNQMRVEEFLGDKIPVEWLAEDEMPKEIKIPGRNDEREFSDDDEGAEGGSVESSRSEGRGGRDRGGRGRNDRSARGDRGRTRDRSGRPSEGGPDRNRGPRPQRGPRLEQGPQADRAQRDDRPMESYGSAPEAMDSSSYTPKEPGNDVPSYPRERDPMGDRGPRHDRGGGGGRSAEGGHHSSAEGGHRSSAEGGHRSSAEGGHRSSAEGGHRSSAEGGHRHSAEGGREDTAEGTTRDGLAGGQPGEGRYGRDRGGRGGRRDERGGRDRGGRGRDRGGRGDRDRDYRGEREPSVDPKTLPSPLTGNPVIYDMQSGKPKNRTAEEFRQVMDEYNGRLANNDEKFGSAKRKAGGPAIIKKISSKVTALFGKRGE